MTIYLRPRLLAALVCAFAFAAPKPAQAEVRLTFEQHVRPILKAHCFLCHGEEDEVKGELDLRLAGAILRGGDSGRGLAPGKHAESLLWQRVDADEMPPHEKKLTAAEKATIAKWIDQGARTARSEPNSLPTGPELTPEERSFWSFQPIRRVEPPETLHADLVRAPVDAFLLAALEARELSFSPEADRRTLIRRASFDLLGLPPTPQDVEQFVSDRAPDAYDRLIDRLLASPHYGEQWARHWLDVAGYADSDGYSPKDATRKFAYKYRDYLIRALNDDRPWNELICEQLAGDEMLKPPFEDLSPADAEKLIATGFLRMGPDGTSDPSVDQDVARNDVVAETIKIVSTSLLGLSVGCAQCHSHRYDPIPQADYYRLRAIFEPAYDWKHWKSPGERLVSLMSSADRKRALEFDAEVARLEKEKAEVLTALVEETAENVIVAEVPEELRDEIRAARAGGLFTRTDREKQLLKDYPRANVTIPNVYLYDRKRQQKIVDQYAKSVAEARANRPVEEYVHCLTEPPGAAPATNLFFRGDFKQPRQTVAPGELTVLAATATPIPVDDPNIPTTGRRLAYARNLTSGEHPLTARVLVNRVWMHHFGRGIVATPADFGRLGELPSHPELLDALATDFMDSGWRLKRMHKQLMCSTAYRQTSSRSDALDTIDSENRLLGRMSVRRLNAEEVRDAILATSGRLSRKTQGPPVPVTLDEVGQVVLGVDNRTPAAPVAKRVPLGEEEFRRSMYVQIRRTMPLGMLETFDAATLAPNCELRSASTAAPQSLLMLNNEFMLAECDAFAERLRQLAPGDLREQLRAAWHIAFVEEPTDAQLENGTTFVEAQRAAFIHSAAAAASSKDAPATAAAKPVQPAAAKDAASPNADPDKTALANFCQILLMSNGFLYVD